MIDFQNGSFVKLKPVSPATTGQLLQPIMVQGEQIVCAFQGIRDSVTFTNMRIVAINVRHGQRIGAVFQRTRQG